MCCCDKKPVSDLKPIPSNNFGVAGFIVSLVGLFLTCGVLSPLGMFLSFFGLFRAPRGLATAGFILGSIGTMFIGAVSGGILIAAIEEHQAHRHAMIEQFHRVQTQQQAAQKVIPPAPTETQKSITEAMLKVGQAMIVAHKETNQGFRPGLDEGQAMLNLVVDAWGHSLRYNVMGDEDYEIRSLGPDGEVGTDDDMVVDTLEKPAVTDESAETAVTQVNQPLDPECEHCRKKAMEAALSGDRPLDPAMFHDGGTAAHADVAEAHEHAHDGHAHEDEHDHSDHADHDHAHDHSDHDHAHDHGEGEQSPH